MDTYNTNLTNFVYQGGDDAIAIKPRSYNIFIQNVRLSLGGRLLLGADPCEIITLRR